MSSSSLCARCGRMWRFCTCNGLMFPATPIFGAIWASPLTARASRKVILIAEEIVAPEVIASDPNRTLIPGFLVTAVVQEPWGAHPSPVQGYYGRDHDFFHEYHDQTRE